MVNRQPALPPREPPQILPNPELHLREVRIRFHFEDLQCVSPRVPAQKQHPLVRIEVPMAGTGWSNMRSRRSSCVVLMNSSVFARLSRNFFMDSSGVGIGSWLGQSVLAPSLCASDPAALPPACRLFPPSRSAFPASAGRHHFPLGNPKDKAFRECDMIGTFGHGPAVWCRLEVPLGRGKSLCRVEERLF